MVDGINPEKQWPGTYAYRRGFDGGTQHRGLMKRRNLDPEAQRSRAEKLRLGAVASRYWRASAFPFLFLARRFGTSGPWTTLALSW